MDGKISLISIMANSFNMANSYSLRKSIFISMRAMRATLIMLIMMLFSAGCADISKKNNEEDSEVLLAAGNTVTPPAPEYEKAAAVNVSLGLGYLAQGQTARAKSKLTHALELAPNAVEAHSAMAYFHERVGEIKDAEKEHKKATKLSGKGAVYNNYGAFLCRQGRLKEADNAFKQALLDGQYERTAEVYENAGLCALKGSELEVAKEYLKTALQQDPHRPNTLLELTELNLKQGNVVDAKNYLAKYKKIAEPSARGLWLGIQIAHLTNDQDAVASQALVLKNMFENSPEYQLYQASEMSK